jgi:hypothetical protein
MGKDFTVSSDTSSEEASAQSEQIAAQQQAAQNANQQQQQNRTDTKQVGNIVHNETGGLRPEANKGSGSSKDLHDAKVAISDVVQNRESAGNNGGVASDKVSSKERNSPQY